MEVTLLIALVLLPFLLPTDPAPSLLRTKAESRNLHCEHTTVEAASRLFPGRIEPAQPRGDYTERSVVVCREPLMRPGIRAARDEAVLSSLSARASDLALTVESLHPNLADHTWMVETYYPDGPVSAKISFATRNALVGQGLSVTDRTPILAVGDISILTKMSPDVAYPAACQRYAALGSLGEGEALLAVVSRDPRETDLHAGLCVAGQWTWLK